MGVLVVVVVDSAAALLVVAGNLVGSGVSAEQLDYDHQLARWAMAHLFPLPLVLTGITF